MSGHVPTVCGQALVRRVQLDSGLETWNPDIEWTLCSTDSKVAEVFDVSPRTAMRWRRGIQRIGLTNADRYAVMLGYHPIDIWPEWNDIPIFHSDRCPCEECGSMTRAQRRARNALVAS